MIKIKGINLNEGFYNYFLEFCNLNSLNPDLMSLTELKGLINEVKQLYKHNPTK